MLFVVQNTLKYLGEGNESIYYSSGRQPERLPVPEYTA